MFGNVLAVLAGLADAPATRRTLDALTKARVNDPYPVRAVTRPIKRSNSLWRPYMARHRQNFVWQYHNGGIWPMVGGFWVTALAEAGRTGAVGARETGAGVRTRRVGIHRMAAREDDRAPRNARAILERRGIPHRPGRGARRRRGLRAAATECRMTPHELPALTEVLAAVVAAVEAEGEHLLAEFPLPGGPGGAGLKAPIDVGNRAAPARGAGGDAPCSTATRPANALRELGDQALGPPADHGRRPPGRPPQGTPGWSISAGLVRDRRRCRPWCTRPASPRPRTRDLRLGRRCGTAAPQRSDGGLRFAPRHARAGRHCIRHGQLGLASGELLACRRTGALRGPREHCAPHGACGGGRRRRHPVDPRGERIRHRRRRRAAARFRRRGARLQRQGSRVCRPARRPRQRLLRRRATGGGAAGALRVERRGQGGTPSPAHLHRLPENIRRAAARACAGLPARPGGRRRLAFADGTRERRDYRTRAFPASQV